MKGMTKVEGVGTEEIIAFLEKEGFPHETTLCEVGINHRDGYKDHSTTPKAFKTRIRMHPTTRDRILAHFPQQKYNEHYEFRALYKPDSPDFIEDTSGLVEIIDGLVVIDTAFNPSTEYSQ